jgi:hypothetical protein
VIGVLVSVVCWEGKFAGWKRGRDGNLRPPEEDVALLGRGRRCDEGIW